MDSGRHRRRGFAAIALIAAIGAVVPAAAQPYPNRPITLVVPFPPGGSATIVARSIADKLGEALGQQIVVDNRGGAAGSIGARQVAKSAPDGYTILLAFTGTLAVSPLIFANTGYDPRKDFAAIGLVGEAPSVFAAHPAVPAQSVADLIKLAKASPGRFHFGSPGIGTINHLAGELFASMADIKLTHVPYKGTGPAVTDLLGGHIALMFVPIPAAHGNVTSGMLRALGVTSARRSRLLPDVPTVAESGLPGFEVVQRSALLAPAGTPRHIIERLNRELNAVLVTDEVRKRLALEGGEPIPGAPEEYTADIEREETRWSALVKTIGLKGE
jgi:tripartite-type tricarboxylate transporter receptor subunit TctC